VLNHADDISPCAPVYASRKMKILHEENEFMKFYLFADVVSLLFPLLIPPSPLPFYPAVFGV
jgi:hypothetical protein